MTRIYVGIDNGVSGGLAAITEHGAIIDTLQMPIQKARKGNEIDVMEVWKWINAEGVGWPREALTVTIEEPGGSKSAKAATSMAGSFHALRTICTLKGLRFHRVTPQLWQKKMLPGCAAGDSKPRALELARRLWPDESFLASERSRVPDMGLVDAALIAEWSRKERL